jgi:hypothetical protein
MTRDFSGESRTTQVDFDEFVKKAEAESQGLTKACCQFLRAWYWARTEEAAKKQSELTKSIGKRRVDELKEEVRALQKQTEAIVEEHLGGVNKLWWHRTLNGDPYYSAVEIDSALSFAAGRLGPILERYGYAPTDGRHNPWRVNGSATAESNYRLERTAWSDEMRAGLERYIELCRKAHQEKMKMDGIDRERTDAEAAALWDEE